MTFEPTDQGRLGRDAVDRRERLLQELRPVVVRRGVRRRLTAAGGLLVIALATGAAAWTLATSHPAPLTPSTEHAMASYRDASTHTPAQQPTTTHSAQRQEPTVALELVPTSKGIAHRVETRTTGAPTATDDDLLEALLASGQDAAIVRVDGRVVVAGDLARKPAP
ncbi:MAG TPA: hypothetical protein VD997_09660 [Phycisphaerales bacterium]|nr:hypothetical protein [Phycisphaerales bacterium]